jgi:hypothetical protein
MRFPVRQDPEDWAVLALILAMAVLLLVSDGFWRFLPF